MKSNRSTYLFAPSAYVRYALRTGFILLSALFAGFAPSAFAQALQLEKTVYVGDSGVPGCAGAEEVARELNGTTITFCFTVTAGPDPLTNVVIDDAAIGFNSIIGNMTSGQVVVLSQASTVTGDVTNVAIVTGLLNGVTPVEDRNSARVDETVNCPSVCYVVQDIANSGGPDQLLLFDTDTLISSFIAQIHPLQPNPPVGFDANCLESSSFEPAEIAPDPSLPRLFSVDGGPGCSNGPGTDNQGFLGTINYDPLQGPVGLWQPYPNPIGTGTGVLGRLRFNDIDGLVFDTRQGPVPVLYAAVRNSGFADVLIQIDYTTGQVVSNAFGAGQDYVPFGVVVTPQGPLIDVDDIAISGLNGQLWGIANNSGSFDELVRFDKFTGQVITNFPLLAPDGVTRFNDMEGLSFDSVRGELYGTTGTSAGAFSGSIFKIQLGDAPNPGQSVLLGPVTGLTNPGDHEAVDCFRVTPETFTTIDGFVFWDPAEQGFYSGAEPPVENALVTLILDVDADGLFDDTIDVELDLTLTDSNGNYSFIVPINQNYIVLVTEAGLPVEACGFTTPNFAALFIPDLCGITEEAPDFGIKTCRALGDFVWDDLNQNGIQDMGEPGIQGATVNLLDIGGNVITNTVTDAFGAYLFERLAASNYLVEVVLPGAYQFTAINQGGDSALDSDIDPFSGISFPIALFDLPILPQLVATNTTVDAGAFLANDVAIFKNTGPVLASASNVNFEFLLVVSNAGDRVATNIAVTDPLPVGLDYVSDAIGGTWDSILRTWSFVVPTLDPGAATNLAFQVVVTDSSIGGVQNEACVAIALPDADPANNCDRAGLALIGDRVWQDGNQNGVQDPSEASAGVPGVVVNLYNGGGLLVGTTTTDAQGIYLFTVPPGGYIVEFVSPSGATFTTPFQGGDAALDSDADQTTGRSSLLLVAGLEENRTIDAGLLVPLVVEKEVSPALASSGNVTFDYLITVSNTSAIAAFPVLLQDTLPDWVAYVSDNVGGSAAGQLFTADIGPLAPNASTLVSIRVEVTGAAISADLVNTAIVNDVFIAVQTNAVIGDFVFRDNNYNDIQDGADSAIPGITVNLFDINSAQVGTTTTDANGQYAFIVPPGTYSVEFVRPSGTDFVTPLVGGDNALDSDADLVTGRSASVVVLAGEINDTIDAGVVVPLTVTKNVGAAIPGSGDLTFDYIITVKNTSALAADPVVVTDILPTWATYLSDNAGGGVLGNTFTANIGPLAGFSQRVINVRVVVTGASPGVDLVNTAAVNNVQFAVQTNAFIGDLVFVDTNYNNVQDGSDTPVAGATVNLYNDSLVQIASATTSASGLYSFVVPPGTYSVGFVRPNGTEFVTPFVGGDPTLATHADRVTGLSSPLTLVAGEVNTTLDAGVTIPLDISKTVSAPLPGTGSVTFDYVITVSNPSDLAANPATITDTLPAWTSYLSDDASGSFTNGIFTAEIGPIGPQSFRTVNVRVAVTDPSASVDLVNTAAVNTIFFAFQTNAVIGDVVFLDSNGNHIQDANDTRVPGAVVNLYDAAGVTQLASTTTDSAGEYAFVVPPGTYVVGFEAPVGTDFVTSNVGGEAVDSDADVLTGLAAPVSVIAGEINRDVDAGVRIPLDVDKTVGAALGSTTNVTFNYFISVVNNSTITADPVTVRDPLPDWALYISDDASGSLVGNEFLAQIGPLAPGASRTVTLQVAVLEGAFGSSLINTAIVNETLFAVQSNARIGDVVFLDNDLNGVQSTGDTPVPGTVVNLYNASYTTLLASTNTDVNGEYAFIVPPGTYGIEFVPPTGSEFVAQGQGGDPALDSDADPASGRTSPITVANGENNDTIDAGLLAPITITKATSAPLAPVGGDVSFDYIITVTNESELEANPVFITDILPVWATYLSDNAGGSVSNGVFSVNVGPLAGFASRAVNVRVAVTDAQVGVSLINTAAVNNVAFAVQTNAFIGDLVFNDVNEDGIQDSGDNPVPGATVNLYDGTGAQLVGTTVTDNNGLYNFIVPPGDYVVEFIRPTNTEFVTPFAGAPDVDSDADSVTGRSTVVTLAPGEINTTIDAGVLIPFVVTKTAQVPAAGTGDVTFDYVISVTNPSSLTADPVQLVDVLPVWASYVSDNVSGSVSNGVFTADIGPMLPGAVQAVTITVAVIDADPSVSLVNTAIVNNIYVATHTNAFLGDLVFIDTDRSNTQNTGDLPAVGSVVEIWNATAGTQYGSATTDSNGNYGFIVPPGNYVVRFASPPGFQFAVPNAGSDDIDSDADTVTGISGVYSLASGEVNTTADAGIQELVPGIQVSKTVYVGNNGIAGCPGSELVTVLAGTEVTYCFQIINTGETHLVNIQLVDNDVSPAVNQSISGILAPSESVTVAVLRVANNDLINTATVTGVPSTPPGTPIGFPPVTDDDTAEVDVIGPSISISKTIYAGHNGGASCEGTNFLLATNGTPVTYCFVVTNTGDSILDQVNFTDGDLDPTVNVGLGTLLAGQSVTSFVERVATVDLVNLATATGIPPAGPPVTDDDTAEVDVINPAIDLQKSVYIGADGGVSCPGVNSLVATNGNVVTYCFVITNTGDVDLTNVNLSDFDIQPVVNATVVPLLPIGGAVTAFVERVVSGDLLNVATATGVPPIGPPPTSTDDAEVDEAPRAIIGDFVWNDLNADGIQDLGEPGLEGVVVFIDLNNDGVRDANEPFRTTDSTGAYIFTNVVSGAVVVRVDQTTVPLAPGFVTTGDPDGVPDGVSAFTIAAGETRLDQDFGFMVPFIDVQTSVACIDDTAVISYTIQPVGFVPTNGVAITWVDAQNVVRQSLTAQPLSGSLLWPGTVIGPNGVIDWPGWVLQNGVWIEESDGLRPSMNVVFSVNPAATNLVVYPPATPFCSANPLATVGDFVWLDLDGDGIQDVSEPGVQGVIVRLVDVDGIQPTLVTTTDVNGAYFFSPRLGSFFVDFDLTTLPPNTIVGPQDVGGDDLIDSDVDSATGRASTSVVLLPGTVDLSVDMSVVPLMSITGQVREDIDADGNPSDPDPGISGVFVRLFEDNNNDGIPDGPAVRTTTTDSSGNYTFTAVPPGVYLVVQSDEPGYVSTFDVDGPNDNTIRVPLLTGVSSSGNDFLDTRPIAIGNFVWDDLNGNGLQDPGEPGIGDVTVELLNASGAVVATTTTSPSGLYVFSGQLAGQYSVRFVLSTLPSGYVVTPSLAGPDATNSDANPVTGLTATRTLISGELLDTLDMGAYLPVSIGDRVWFDENNNGVQDVNELLGVEGITVILYSTATSQPVATNVTNLAGTYLFGGLPPGSYFVGFDLTTLPPNTLVAPRNAVQGNTLIDSDADPVTGLTGPTGFLTSGSSDSSLDMGVVPLGVIGDTVWNDDNLDGIPNENLVERGQPGVNILLYRIDSGVPVFISSTITSSNMNNRGYYEFTNLPPAEYLVALDNSTVPPFLMNRTTPTNYVVNLIADASVLSADFGVVGKSTSVELDYFRATAVTGGVSIEWATGSESDNFGFMVYRSRTLNGVRTAVNSSLIEGQGTGAGRDYSLFDPSVPPGRYFYWLEDIEFDLDTMVHGPAVVVVPQPSVDDPTDSTESDAAILLDTAGVFFFPVSGDATTAAVEVNGNEVASLLSGEMLIFYSSATNSTARLTTRQNPVRMEEAIANPQGGRAVLVIAEESGQSLFSTVDDADSYLVIGFTDGDIIVLDISNPSAPVVLKDAALLKTLRDNGVYFSHRPENGPARIQAIQRPAIRRVDP